MLHVWVLGMAEAFASGPIRGPDLNPRILLRLRHDCALFHADVFFSSISHRLVRCNSSLLTRGWIRSRTLRPMPSTDRSLQGISSRSELEAVNQGASAEEELAQE